MFVALQSLLHQCYISVTTHNVSAFKCTKAEFWSKKHAESCNLVTGLKQSSDLVSKYVVLSHFQSFEAVLNFMPQPASFVL